MINHFILSHFQFSNEYFSDIIISVVVFDDGHVWCTKKHDKTWYILDSLSSKPEPIQFNKIFNQRGGFGWIIVWKPKQFTPNQS